MKKILLISVLLFIPFSAVNAQNKSISEATELSQLSNYDFCELTRTLAEMSLENMRSGVSLERAFSFWRDAPAKQRNLRNSITQGVYLHLVGSDQVYKRCMLERWWTKKWSEARW